jgi:hypothetical protein
MATVPERVNAAELLANADAIEAAMNEAIREALLDHQRAGNPVAEWRNGQVVWILPEEILLEEEPRH